MEIGNVIPCAAKFPPNFKSPRGHLGFRHIFGCQDSFARVILKKSPLSDPIPTACTIHICTSRYLLRCCSGRPEFRMASSSLFIENATVRTPGMGLGPVRGRAQAAQAMSEALLAPRKGPFSHILPSFTNERTLY